MEVQHDKREKTIKEKKPTHAKQYLPKPICVFTLPRTVMIKIYQNKKTAN